MNNKYFKKMLISINHVVVIFGTMKLANGFLSMS
jgi:hypothetical protein